MSSLEKLVVLTTSLLSCLILTVNSLSGFCELMPWSITSSLKEVIWPGAGVEVAVGVAPDGGVGVGEGVRVAVGVTPGGKVGVGEGVGVEVSPPGVTVGVVPAAPRALAALMRP